MRYSRVLLYVELCRKRRKTLAPTRLHIRHWRPGEWPAALALLTNERTMADIGRIHTEAEVHAWFYACVAAARERPTWQWALEHKADGCVIGFCGPKPQIVDGEERLEIGYRLLPEYWGQGLASEAASFARDFVFDELDEPDVISIIPPSNAGSIRVAEKLGMTVEKETVYKGFEVRIYQLTNPRGAGAGR